MTKKIIKISLILFITAAILTVPLTIMITAAQEKRVVSGYVGVSPKLAGLGETVTVIAFITPQPVPLPGEGLAGYQVYENMYVDLTNPDGTTVTKGPYRSYQEGTIFFTYVPNMLGDWSAKLIWAGDYQNEGLESPAFTFTVQEEPAPREPQVPLPTELWERPINAENRLWATITGEWWDNRYAGGYNASSAFYNPYSTAPNTAHILWKHQYLMGGIIGGDYGTTRYATTYQPSLAPITICGRCYYMWNNIMHCIDMQTGEEILSWEAREGNSARSMSGYTASADLLMAYDNLADRPQSGFAPWIWVWNSSSLMKYDPMDGTQMWHLRPPAGPTFGTTYLVPIEGYGYTTMGGNWSGTLVKWDLWHGRRDPTNLTRPSSTDFEEKIVWAKPMPAGTSMNSISGDVVYCQGRTHAIPTITTHGSMDTETGNILWRKEGPHYFAEIGAPGYGVAAWPNSNDMKWYAHDLKTGAVKWVSAPGDYPWSAFWGYGTIAAYGNFYGLSYDGVYAMDAETGEAVWTFHPEDNYDTVYNTLPFWQVSPAAADGKIYVGNGEHTMGDPMLRGCKLYCLDGATGDEIWKLAFGGAGYKAIADGKLIIGNEYDHHFYCFTKGPTATTVTAPKTQVIQGESLVIEGTVTDQSPAQPGTAAISDEDMSAWMEYLHMQKPIPGDAKGVDVSLDVIDANGNFRSIGTATSDMSGVYSFVWEPDIPGQYTVIATFAGSESYGSSYAQTSFYVEEAPQPTPPPEPTPAPMTDTYIAGSTIAIVAAIAVVAFLILRKK